MVKKLLRCYQKKDVDLIIELIGGAEGPAKNLVFQALKNKKHVVTANKALIAKYGDQLAKIAEKNERLSNTLNKAVLGKNNLQG